MIRKMYVRISCIFSTDTFPASVRFSQPPPFQPPSAFFSGFPYLPYLPHFPRLPRLLQASATGLVHPASSSDRPCAGGSFVNSLVSTALCSRFFQPPVLSASGSFGSRFFQLPVLSASGSFGSRFFQLPALYVRPSAAGVISPARVSETRCRRAGARRRARSCACATSGSRRSSRVSGCGRWPGRRSSS